MEPSSGTHSGEGVTKEMEGHGVCITCPCLELCAVTGPGSMELSKLPKFPKSSGGEALMLGKGLVPVKAALSQPAFPLWSKSH